MLDKISASAATAHTENFNLEVSGQSGGCITEWKNRVSGL